MIAVNVSHLSKQMIVLLITLLWASFGETVVIDAGLAVGLTPGLAIGLTPGLTAAQKLHGFSGNYGLGGGLGGLTLNDIAYDLSRSFTDATRDVGVKLGLPSPKVTQVFVNPLLVENQKYGSAQDFIPTVVLEKKLETINPTESDVLLTSHSSPFKTNIGVYSEPRPYLTKLKNGYKYMYFSMGDRLSSKLTSDVPFYTSKYRLDSPKISGYTSKVIHTSKPYNGLSKLYGESSVSFTKLHTGPSIQSIPQLKQRTIIEPNVLNSFNSYTPFSYEYPTEYGSAISKRYVSEKNGGFGSLLTGSYGTVLYNGYKSAQLFPDLFRKK